jgi:hypothetical protein
MILFVIKFDKIKTLITQNSFFIQLMIMFVFTTIYVIILFFKRFITFLLQCFTIMFKSFIKTFIVFNCSFFWHAESNVKIEKKNDFRQISMHIINFFQHALKINDFWLNMSLKINFFKQLKIYKTRVLSIVFWLLFKCRRSCRVCSRRKIQCSLKNIVIIIVALNINHVRKNILISKNNDDNFWNDNLY